MREPWLRPALAVVLLITALRIALLPFDRAELFVDEAQYWLWGQHPDFGYYSKPPLIGWLLGLMSATCGDSPFCIRLPGALLHAATALILGGIAARRVSARAGVLVAAGYVTTPIVAIGALQIATDSIMAPLMALSLAAWFACLGGAGLGMALAGGIALGLAFMAKYAAIYYLLTGLIAWALLRPRASGRHLLMFLLGFLLAIAPNLIWNIAEGFPTLQHTMDNADWVRDPEARAGIDVPGMLGFLASQTLVFGPILFPALIWFGLRWRTRDAAAKQALAFALPILAIVAVQALVSHALLNWAGAAYIAGTLAVLPYLTRPWLIASFVLNGAICIALPVATLFADSLTLGGKPVFERYLGRVEMSEEIIAAAKAAGLTTIVAGDRNILADLYWTGRESGLTFRAIPPKGRPTDHYQFRYAYQPGPDPVLLVLPGSSTPKCDGAEKLSEIAPTRGTYSRSPRSLWKVPGDCLTPG